MNIHEPGDMFPSYYTKMPLKAPIDPRFDPRHAAQLYPRAQPPGVISDGFGHSAFRADDLQDFLRKSTVF